MPRLKSVYGGPWSKMGGEIQLDAQTLKRLGDVLVESVVAEARKDMAKQRKAPVRGQPEGLPDSEEFLESFSYRIVGNRTVEISSSWPVAEQLVEGTPPYQMLWFTKTAGVDRVPMIGRDGRVIICSTPLGPGTAWVHPGFRRHTFLARGIQKGREKAIEIVRNELVGMLLSGDPLR